MADALTSAVVDQLVSRAFQKIEEELGSIKNVNNDVEKLKSSWGDIQALLVDAEKKQFNSELLKRWLSDLEDISYDMGDVLDEWNSAILKSEIKKDHEEGGYGESSSVLPPKKVCFPVPSSCFCIKQVKQVIRYRDFAKRIKQLNQELDSVKNKGQGLGLDLLATRQLQQENTVVRDLTISLVDESVIKGRVEDKENLISKLLDDSSKKIDFIPIVGMGGLGKTTLAKLAYNDDHVKTHFDKRIWVCVSVPFDLFKIFKAILEALEGDTKDCEQLETLVQRICVSIERKKFLLVLDDVWTEEKVEWEKLEQTLRLGGVGSRILVTTRKVQVATMMRTMDIIYLKELSAEECWKIIKQVAFVEGEDEIINQLEEIGQQIANKCKGLPLVAKVLGGLMWSKKTKNDWENILHNKLWESKDTEVKDNIFAPLLLSYYDLSPMEKCCFSYCSLFPKDYGITRDMLIEMWMSEGYVGDSIEGQRCFESLIMRSFFQVFQEFSFGNCLIRIHDLIHDFALVFLTKNRNVIVEGENVRKKIESLDAKACHFSVLHGNLDSSNEFLTSFKNIEKNILKKLRTFFLFSDKFEVDFQFVCQNLIGLRTISLANCGFIFNRGFIFPQDIVRLVHLRYLDISDNLALKELPDTLCDLCNLQTLKVDFTGLERLPEGIGKLVNLRYLYIKFCEKLEGLPKGIRKLNNLQKLDWLDIPENKDAYFHFGDLKKWNCQLQGSLLIRGCGNFKDVGEGENTSLVKMKDLKYLSLNFDARTIAEEDLEYLSLDFDVRTTAEKDPQQQGMIAEALKPHPDLEDLRFNNYMGTVFPSWMTSLINLRSLYIDRSKNCEILPPLGKLRWLESLRIQFTREVKRVGVEFLGITEGDEDGDSFVSFPKLKQLRFSDCSDWKEWEGSKSATLKVMPCLRSLQIWDCHSLEALPDFLRMIPLQDINVWNCEILEQSCRDRKGKEWLTNSHIKNIRINGKYIQKDGIWIQKDDDTPESKQPYNEIESNST